MAYSENDINELYDFTDRTCFYCEKWISFKNYGAVGEVGAWEVDHFIPLHSSRARWNRRAPESCAGLRRLQHS